MRQYYFDTDRTSIDEVANLLKGVLILKHSFCQDHGGGFYEGNFEGHEALIHKNIDYEGEKFLENLPPDRILICMLEDEFSSPIDELFNIFKSFGFLENFN